jgi:sorting nexin-29
MDDYRGIAVGQSIAKLFSITLLRRIDAWAELNCRRACGQAGFRKGRGTSDNAFILTHIIDKYAHCEKPLYIAFIDFRKAYDSVDRSVLWAALAEHGLHGPVLETLKAMYSDVRMAVRLAGEVGELFDAPMGVKQGDPLSPLLFGLLIDRLEPYLRLHCPTIGAELATLTLSLLLYADDLCLIAESPRDLQTLLDNLHTFCGENKLTVNPSKSVAVVFNPPDHPRSPPPLLFNGKNIPYAPDFPYLGMLFNGCSNLKEAWKRNSEKGAQASYQVARQANTMELFNVHLRTNTFNTMALPLLTYGCPVWGPQALLPTSSTYAGATLDKIQTDFLKQSLGLSYTVSHAALKHELGYTRPSSRMLQQILTFREKILMRPDNDLVRLALIENIEMANDKVSKCWSFQLQRLLSRDTSSLPSSLSSPLAHIDPDLALREREEKLDAALNRDAANLGLLHPNTPVHSLPDDARRGFKTLKYLKWCKPITPATDPKHQLRASFYYNLHSKPHIYTIARLRMSNLPLRNECRLNNLVRSQRTCTLCNTNSVEDEYHLLTCPTYQYIRDLPHFSHLRRYWDLPDPATSPPDTIINHRFNPPAHLWRTFATLLNQCLNMRQDLLQILPPPNPT